MSYNLASPYWVKDTVPFTSIQTGGLTNTLNIYVLPAKSLIHYSTAIVTTAFSGTSIATLTLSLGVSGTAAKFMAASSLTSTGNLPGVGLSIPDMESTSSGTNVQGLFTAVGANLSALSQGSVDIYLLVSTLL